MRRTLLALACLALAVPVFAQRVQGDRGPGEAIPVRCVNTLGTSFESCGGGGGAGADVNITGVGGNAVTTTVPVSGTITFANTSLAVTNVGTFAVQAAPITFASPQHIIVDSGTITTITNPVAVTGTFWQLTQPVSAASLPLPTLAATSTKQSDGSQKTQVVDGSGNVIGATSNALDINIKSGNPTTITATQGTGTNLHTVVDSGSVTVSDGAGAMNVIVDSATLGTVTVSDGAGAMNVIVDSGSLTANAGTNLNTSALALSATQTDRSQKTQLTDGTRDGTVKAASTLPLLTDTAVVTTQRDPLPAGTNLLGKVGIDQTTPGTTNRVDVGVFPDNEPFNVAQFGGTNVSTGTGAGGAGIPRVTVSNDSNVIITPPTLTKGTQGATGLSIQELKDAGRNQTNFFMAIQIVTTATDALLSLTGYKSGAAVGATTTPAVVTSGKTYRINLVTLEYTSIVTTEGSVRFTLRANLSGVVAIGSPAVAVWEVGQTGSGVSVAGKKNTITIPFPDGLEFAAGTGIGLSQVGLSPTGTAAIAGYGRATINGYEY